MFEHRGCVRFALAFLCAVVCAFSGKSQFSVHAQAVHGPQKLGTSDGTQPVIVLLKHQPAVAKVGSSEDSQRASGIANEQQPLLDEVRGANGTHIKSFHLVNAFAATIPQAEIDKLKANPAVAGVIPDGVITRKTQSANNSRSSKTASQTSAATQVTPNTTVNAISGACGANGAVQLAPEGLALTNTDSMVAGAQTARSLGVTGAGVKVAWIADGIDPLNANFIRPQDSLSVFDPSIGGDYQDFSGDGPNAPTDGGEAFLDSNTIAGQGIQVYDVSQYDAYFPVSPCNVIIEGVAPGAALVGLKVFAQFQATTESNFLNAIDYAVEVDHVDVLNESFGANNFPDTALDATRQFDEAAVAAGVFVTVSSGDSGFTNTIGSPASDPMLMSVGASTQFQSYAESNYDFADDFGTTGWLSNNISNLSSGGFTEAGNTIDMIAPGDLSWVSCDSNGMFLGCFVEAGQYAPIQLSGGTSESSPFVAGAAALVIQAYRQTHGGASPSPALIKQILVSSASDLGAPAIEQGAGLLNSYQAVLLAKSVGGAGDSPTPQGNTLLLSTNQLNAVAEPGTQNTWTVNVTNTGATPQTVSVYGRTLGPLQNVQSGTVTLDASSSPQLPFVNGTMEAYQTFQFTVPAGASHLDVSMAYPGFTQGYDAHLILIDPLGRYAANSLPQGIGNFANDDVIAPAAGNWTGVIIAHEPGVQTIPWRAAVEHYVPFASVSPRSLTLAPGQSRPVTITAATPGSPGDTDGSIVLSSNRGETISVPVTLRSMIPVTAQGAFSGLLTGGNGRNGLLGENLYYQFVVPPGIPSIAAKITPQNDPNYLLGLYLISPDGDTLGQGSNVQETFQIAGGASAYTLRPAPGLWTLIVNSALPDGTEVSQPLNGDIVFNGSSVRVNASALPNNPRTRLAAGVPVTIPVSIINNGPGVGYFFADARLNSMASVLLPNLQGATSFPVPWSGTPPIWTIPTETQAVAVTQDSSTPMMFDTEPWTGDPDIPSAGFGASPSCSTTSSVAYAPPGGTVTPGYWYVAPSECGPYADSNISASANISVWATTAGFDPNVTSDTGDYWIYAVNQQTTQSFNPLAVNPGQRATFNVYITPQGQSGSVVSGTLYINNYVFADLPAGVPTADEVIALPYSYRIQ